jgi:light-regulated signal transduction histidine kinase (bacteriophytochrome)
LNAEKDSKLNQVKNLLIESQAKWNNFSNKLLKISEDLYFLLEQTGAIQSVNEQWLSESVQKLNSYRNFLMKLNQERESMKMPGDTTSQYYDQSEGFSEGPPP